MSAPLKFSAQKGKVVVTVRDSQCTLDAEEAMKLAHKLMAVSEKALRRAGRVHEE